MSSAYRVLMVCLYYYGLYKVYRLGVYRMACMRYIDFICELHRMCEHIVCMRFVEYALCVHDPWSIYGIYEYMWHTSGIYRCTWGLWGMCNI